MKKLRLLITDKCDRSCEGCCNKDWDIANLPIYPTPPSILIQGWDQVILTGGEPMLDPKAVAKVILYIVDAPQIILYTAKTDDLEGFKLVNPWLYGLTVTLHEQKDVQPFLELDHAIWGNYPNKGSIHAPVNCRLNIFRGVELPDAEKLLGWKTKKNIEWIKNCPLPSDEVFMRYAL